MIKVSDLEKAVRNVMRRGSMRELRLSLMANKSPAAAKRNLAILKDIAYAQVLSHNCRLVGELFSKVSTRDDFMDLPRPVRSALRAHVALCQECRHFAPVVVWNPHFVKPEERKP